MQVLSLIKIEQLKVKNYLIVMLSISIHESRSL